MERATYRAVMALAILLGTFGQTIAVEREIRGKVGYIAGGTVYVDVGRSNGIAVGDSLLVVRNDETIGAVVVVSSASNAASCTPLIPLTEIRIGDEVTIEKEIPSGGEETPGVPITPGKPSVKRKNKIDGTVSLGSVLSEDLTESGLGFSRPSLSTRIRIRDIAGRPFTLDVRHRTRYHDRERRIQSSGPEDRWTHQIYRFSLTFEDEETPYLVQLGRFLPSMPRGIGYVDGLLLKCRTHGPLGFGAIAGFRPDNYSAELRFDEKTIGGFTTLDLDLGNSESLGLSAAFTGNYRSGTVNREFFVSEGSYSSGGRFSASGSVEIDLNRGWKRAMGERYLDVTSLFVGSRYRITDDLSLNLSYDSRRPPRTIDNRATPDSLFDDSLRRGFHAGASWSVNPRIQLTGSSGVRIRDGHDNTISAAGSVRIREFPVTGLITSGRFAMFQTMFSRGYRPMVEFGLKSVADVMLNLRFGDTIYDMGGERSHDPWIGSSLNYWISRRQFLTINFNGHLSERLRSAQLSGETGVRF